MGAPLGNQNGRKAALFAQHLEVVLNQQVKGESGTKLRMVVEKAVDAAIAGESWAIQFVADRIDGKAKQQVEISGDPDKPINVSTYLDALAGAAALRASHTAGLVDGTNPNAYPSVEER
jgi:hypothetical protein